MPKSKWTIEKQLGVVKTLRRELRPDSEELMTEERRLVIMRQSVELEKINDHHFEVRLGGKNSVGQFLMDVDGFFYYFPIENGGAWTAWIMRAIANKLDEINAPWQKVIDAEFRNPGKKS